MNRTMYFGTRMGLLFALAIGLAIPTIAQTPLPKGAENTSIQGTWKWSLDLGPAGGTVTMVVTELKGALRATVTAPDGTSLQADHLSVKKNRVEFSVKREMGVFSMVMSHAGEIDGDEILGTFSVKGGPVKKEGKWHALREKSK